jgi:hypothetical protein
MRDKHLTKKMEAVLTKMKKHCLINNSPTMEMPKIEFTTNQWRTPKQRINWSKSFWLLNLGQNTTT